MKNLFSGNRLVFGFVGLNIVSGTAAGILQMIIPAYALTLQANTAEIGLIKGISGLGMLLMVVPAGFLVDHYGSRRLYILGGILSAAVVFLLPAAVLPVLLILLMGLQGVANSMKFTSLNAAFFRYLNTAGLKKAGWYKGSMSIGLTFLGPFCGGYLVNLAGYKVNFLLVGFMTLIPAILVGMTGSKRKAGEKINFFSIFRGQLWEFREILNNRTIKQTVLTESISTACFSSFAAFIVVLVVNDFKLNFVYASWLMILEGGAFVVTVFLGGALLYRFERSRLYLWSFAVTIAGLTGVGLLKDIRLTAVFTVVLGLGLGMTNLITYSQVGEMGGRKGKLAGFLSACTGIGSTLGPILGGFIGQSFGIPAIFFSFIPAFILLGLYIQMNQVCLNTEGTENKTA